MGAAASWAVPAVISAGSSLWQTLSGKSDAQEQRWANEREMWRQQAEADENNRLAEEARQREQAAYDENKSRLETAKEEAARQIESSFANRATQVANAFDERSRALLARQGMDPMSPIGRSVTRSAAREKTSALDSIAGQKAGQTATNTTRFAEAIASLRAPGYLPNQGTDYSRLVTAQPSDMSGLGELGKTTAGLAGYNFKDWWNSRRKKKDDDDDFVEIKR